MLVHGNADQAEAQAISQLVEQWVKSSALPHSQVRLLLLLHFTSLRSHHSTPILILSILCTTVCLSAVCLSAVCLTVCLSVVVL